MMRKIRLIRYTGIEMLTLAILLTAMPSVWSQDIATANISKYLGNGRWEWKIFVKAEQRVLESIDHVEYELHPTFPRPNRTVNQLGEAAYPFGLTCRGWGVFPVKITVYFKDGHRQRFKHMLEFQSPPVSYPLPITAANTATRAESGMWNWTVFLRGEQGALDQVQCVEYTLHPSFYEPVRERCERGTDERAFALTARGWGTFEIKIRIFLKDGHVQELTHQLVF